MEEAHDLIGEHSTADEPEQEESVPRTWEASTLDDRVCRVIEHG